MLLRRSGPAWLAAAAGMMASAAPLLHACFVSIPPLGDGAGGEAGSAEGGCTPGALVPCYDGPEGSQTIGACRAGTTECAGGGGAGQCTGQLLPALESCDTTPQAGDEDCNTITNDHCATWLMQLGAERNQGVEVISIASGGDLVVAARNTGAIDYGGTELNINGNERGTLARLGPDGQHRWSFQVGSTQKSTVKGAAQGPSGDVFLTGWFAGEVRVGAMTQVGDSSESLYVARVNGNTGAPVWLDIFGNNQAQRGHDLAAGADGIVVVGRLSGNADFGSPVGVVASSANEDAFVVKLSESGAALWAVVAGGPGFDLTERVAVAGNGDVLVTGYFETSVDLGCGAMTAVDTDAFVARLARSTGACVWARSFGGAGAQWGRAIVPNTTTVLVAAAFSGQLMDGSTELAISDGSEDIAVIALDPVDGAVVRHVEFAGAGKQEPWDLAVAGSGDVTLVGSVAGSVDFGGGLMTVPDLGANTDDIFVVTLDAELRHLWSRHFAADGDDDAFSVVAPNDGSLVIGGEFFGSLDFGTGPALSQDTDAYLIRLAP